jgi:hypothetical protein
MMAHIKKLLLTFLASVAVVAILFVYSNNLIHKRNPFIRQFPPHTLIAKDSIDLQREEKFYVSGCSHSNLFLTNRNDLLNLLVFPISDLADSSSIQLHVNDHSGIKFWQPEVKIDSPYFFITDGVSPVIFRGRFGDSASRYPYDSVYFSNIVPITNNSFAIKSLSAANREYQLGKQSLDVPHTKMSALILEKQVDGRFCVDGSMLFNKANNCLIYVYHYRNQFIMIDTNMNVLSRSNTIDTVTKAQIKVGVIESQKALTMLAPPLVVNRKMATYGNLIFINSNLLSQNEDFSLFKNSSVVDVYNLKSGNYKLSFYIPDHRGKKVSSINVTRNALIAFFDDHLKVYELMPEYFRD